MRLAGRPEEKRMAIEIALLVACCVLVSAVIWRSNRVLRRLSEVEGGVSALRGMVSRAFLMQLHRETEVRPSNLDTAPPPPSSATVKNEMRKDDAPEPELEFETTEIDGLCAKLITLAPPQEAAPLLAPDTVPSGDRERRLLSRHQASRIAKIIPHRGLPGGDCTISNVSPAGALLLVANAHGLPKQFDLDMDGYRRPCIARWRQFDRIGVKFESTHAA
jgi:hypothetical protein